MRRTDNWSPAPVGGVERGSREPAGAVGCEPDVLEAAQLDLPGDGLLLCDRREVGGQAVVHEGGGVQQRRLFRDVDERFDRRAGASSGTRAGLAETRYHPTANPTQDRRPRRQRLPGRRARRPGCRADAGGRAADGRGGVAPQWRRGVRPALLRRAWLDRLRARRIGAPPVRAPVLRRLAFIVYAQRIGLSLDEIGDELARLPCDRAPNRRDWSRLSSTWTHRIDERIGGLEPLRSTLTECIGCGCLSLSRRPLANPADRAAAAGPVRAAGGEQPRLVSAPGRRPRGTGGHAESPPRR